MFKSYSTLNEIQLTPAIKDLKGLTNFMRYWRIALLPKQLCSPTFFALYLVFEKQMEKAFSIADATNYENLKLL